MRKIRVLLTGGGTGGHIYPLMAVAEELTDLSRRHNLEINLSFLGAAGRYQPVLESIGIRVYRIIASKWRRYFSPLNFLEPFNFCLGLFQALFKMYFLMPDVLFSKSGPGALPVVIAAAFYRVPIIIHESDALPGLTNRFSVYLAKSVGVAFPSALAWFKARHPRVALVGNPVRRHLINNRDDQTLARRFFGFTPEKFTLLVLGGSQGAEIVNDFIIRNAPELLKKYQIIHQTGLDNFIESRGELEFITADLDKSERQGYHLAAYFNSQELKEAYLAADLIISRAGGGSIFEIASFGKPAILIPLAGHQSYNANAFAEAGAAVVLEQSNLLTNIFLIQVEKILNNPRRLENMKQASSKFYIPHSTILLAEEIFRLARS